MHKIAGLAALTGVSVALATSTTALAVTLGSTSSTGLAPCGNAFVVDTTSASPSYTVPAGGGMIDSWSIDTTGATEGSAIDLVVLRPTGATTFTVVGFDAETLPKPLPADHLATFTLAVPIAVQAGDLVGLYGASATFGCFYTGASASDLIVAGPESAPSNGASYTEVESATADRTNLSVDLEQSMDAGVAETVSSASVLTGGVGVFKLTITNSGPATGTITLSDGVPTGLSILAAASDMGNCTIAGQNITCTLTGVGPGSPAEADIAVLAGSPGAFANVATVTPALSDPNPANNTASQTLTVTAPVVSLAPCQIVSLLDTPLAVAESVLRALDCTVGEVSTQHSKTTPKGDVLSTTPGPATDPAATKVNIVESSGPPKPKKKKAKRKPQHVKGKH